MPSSYPFPSLAALCLSLYSSAHRVERLPRIVEVQPWERAEIVACPPALNWGHYLHLPTMTMTDASAVEGI